jgi:hypothetical protein
LKKRIVKYSATTVKSIEKLYLWRYLEFKKLILRRPELPLISHKCSSKSQRKKRNKR